MTLEGSIDPRLPFKITGTNYRIERMVGGTHYPDRPPTARWRVYERDGDKERCWEEDRP